MANSTVLIRTLTTRIECGCFEPCVHGILTAMGWLCLSFNISLKTCKVSIIARIEGWRHFTVQSSLACLASANWHKLPCGGGKSLANLFISVLSIAIFISLPPRNDAMTILSLYWNITREKNKETCPSCIQTRLRCNNWVWDLPMEHEKLQTTENET